jgi:hypothetical protein
VTSPVQAFGFEPGTDRKLADWKELTAYYQKVASQSDRVRYEELGKTMEGRPFVMLTVSAPENLAHLAEYKEIVTKLSDPRTTSPEEAKTLIVKGKTVVIITFNIHSTEIASAQTAATFIYRMATSNDPDVVATLKNVILLLIPSQNPDGEQLVVDWYKKTLGTPSEGSSPPVLYAKYVGHDDNRDWVGLTQLETQHTAKAINEWHPQILYDLHQQGADAPRLFLPPWVDPIDPNVDPLLVFSMNALGMRTAHDVASTGKTGVLTHGVYDFWSPLRDYISLRGGLRILTESASANIATPIEVPFDKLGTGIGYDAKVAAWNYPNPWKGGTWHLGDIVAYQMDALASITKSAATDRDITVNDPSKLTDSPVLANVLEKQLGAPKIWQGYTVASDTFASLQLARFLDSYGVHTNFSSSADSPHEIVDQENIVTFGTQSSLAAYQSDLDRLTFRMAPHEMNVTDLLTQREFNLVHESDDRDVAPGIVAVIPRGRDGSRIMLIQGAQTMALIAYLISDEGMREIGKATAGMKTPYFEAVILSEVNRGTPLQSRLGAIRAFEERADTGQKSLQLQQNTR